MMLADKTDPPSMETPVGKKAVISRMYSTLQQVDKTPLYVLHMVEIIYLGKSWAIMILLTPDSPFDARELCCYVLILLKDNKFRSFGFKKLELTPCQFFVYQSSLIISESTTIKILI